MAQPDLLPAEVMEPAADYGSIRRSLVRRFYEPVLLTYALTQGFRVHASESVLSPLVGPRKPLSPQERFQKFVYKLALICWSERGGDTVTSIAVLKRGQKVLYALACNQASANRRLEVVEHVRSVLTAVSLSSWNGQNLRIQKQQVMRQILLFNRPRIKLYLTGLRFCLSDYRKNINEPLIDTLIRGLESSLGTDPSDIEYDDNYVDTCNRCLDHIRSNKGAIAQLRRLAESPGACHDTDSKRSSWTELPHLFSRLYSYEEAMGCIFGAREEWPALFENFETFFPADLPADKPRKTPLGNSSLRIDDLVGRLSSEEKILEKLRSAAEDLRHFRLDDLLRSKKGFKPIIHSEVLLYDWMKHSKDARGFGFYKGWRFIGASKPTCRLCKYYIESANDAGRKHENTPPIEVRPSHGNIYLDWAFPNLHDSQASAKAKIWQEIFDKTIERIRDDAFRALMDKRCPGKRHDSNTYDEWSTRASQVGDGVATMSRLSDRFAKGVEIQETLLADDSEDDDIGGAIL